MDYKVEFSDRKNVSISVKGGELKIRAPHGTDKEKIEKIIYKHRRWIVTHLEREITKMHVETQLSDMDIATLKRLASTELGAMTAYYSKVMDLNYTKVKITSAKTRFGSCSSKGIISFSYRLMLYPQEAREYVVVHELAHLKEMNHSKRFYAIVEKYLPDYKARKAKLKMPH